MAGEAGGGQATTLMASGLVAAGYQLLSQTFGLWRETFSTTAFKWGSDLSSKVRLEFNLMTEAAIVGLGYIIGVRYAAIICAGSFLSYFVLVPMVHAIGQHIPDVLAPGTMPIAEMDNNTSVNYYVRITRASGIAVAVSTGIFASVRSLVRRVS